MAAEVENLLAVVGLQVAAEVENLLVIVGLNRQVFRVLLNLTLISGERSGPFTRFPYVGIV